MRLVQFEGEGGERAVAAVEGSGARLVEGVSTVYALAREAAERGLRLAALIGEKGLGAAVDCAALAREGRLLAPVDHPDPAHLVVTGTGLTHLGSAAARDAMHKSEIETAAPALTDSMRMFRMGLEGGRPAPGEIGVQPEWFYKGNGHTVVPPGRPLPSPAFGKDAGEEPEIAGIYLIGADGTPFRLGFALGNEFSDHVTERMNYLFLAHSKLRACSFGPELRLGELPRHLAGTSRIIRDGTVLWQQPFLSGEDNMSHTIANLEHHHFKYELFRRPGDVHVHMFGTATLSFAEGVSTKNGDIFEIDCAEFGLPLTNPVQWESDRPVVIKTL